MYPQPILFLIAMKIKEKKSIIINSMALSFVGGLIAGNHYLLQLGFEDSIGCGTIGYSRCSEFIAFSYGYITVPMMAMTAFALLIILGYGKIRALQMRKDSKV